MPALEGVRVIDLTQFEAGTSCTETLAWLGADVLKIEPPRAGEQGRSASRDIPDIDSFYFLVLNANKRSVAIDLKAPAGRDLLFRLIAEADVFIENFAPGAIERLGLDYDTVRGINDRIIYAQIKGFDPAGPYGTYLSLDPIGQAAGGSVSITGYPDKPVRPGALVADTGTGLHTAIGIIAALYQRQSTGKGQRIGVSMQEAVINYCRVAYTRTLMTGKASARYGNAMPVPNAPADMYPTKPGGPNDYLMIYTSRSPDSDHWPKLLDIIGRPDLKGETRFATAESRAEHAEEVDALIAAWTITYTKREAMDILARAGVPASAVFDTLDLISDPHLRQNGTFVPVDHPDRGTFYMPGWPVRMSDSHVTVTAAPLLGAHTDEVLTEVLGLSAGELDELRSQKVIRSAPQPAPEAPARP